MKDAIYRQDAIDALDCIGGVEEVLRSLPPAQPELTLESAIDYLHSIGWMQEHDRILTESAQPETCEGCKHLGKWENEVEYGCSSPCTSCKRRVSDNYKR